MVFTDLEKAYDSITRGVTWHVLKKKHVHKQYIDVIKDMYHGVIISVRILTSRVCFERIFVSLITNDFFFIILVIDDIISTFRMRSPCLCYLQMYYFN